jgi:transposase
VVANAKRPSREWETLVRSAHTISRIKSALARLDVRGFKQQLRKAPQILESLRTPEDSPIPPNTLDEIRCDITRLVLLSEQIQAIEQVCLTRSEQAPQIGPNAMVRMLASIRGVGIETADMLVQKVLSRTLRDRTSWPK